MPVTNKLKKDLTIKNLSKAIDYKFDVFDCEIDGIEMMLYGKAYSIALQTSLLQAFNTLLNGDNSNFNKWQKFVEKFYSDEKSKIVGKKNPIKKLSIKDKSSEKEFEEIGLKAVKIFISLRDSPDEYDLLFQGLSYKEIIASFNQFINIFIYQLSRPIVEVIGQDLDAAVRLRPGSDVIRIYLSSILGSPFQKKEELANGRVLNYGIKQVSIPYPKKIWNYQTLRHICGGEAGLIWGHWTTRGFFLPKGSDNLREARHLVVSGDTEQRSIDNFNRFIQLSDGELNNSTTTKNRFDYDKAKQRHMKSYPVYPKHIFIERIAYLTHSDANFYEGRKTSQGKKITRKYTIPIYSEAEHPDFRDAFKPINQI